jgi:hypothetical protein
MVALKNAPDDDFGWDRQATIAMRAIPREQARSLGEKTSRSNPRNILRRGGFTLQRTENKGVAIATPWITDRATREGEWAAG